MYTDMLNVFEDGTTTAFTATRLSTDWLDLSTAKRNFGSGENLFMEYLVTTAAIGTAGYTAQLQVVTQPFTTLAAMAAVFTTTHALEYINITAHGLVTGTPVTPTNSGGALPAGMTASRTYFAYVVDANTLKLATTYQLAMAGAPDVFLAGDGTGTHTLTVQPMILASTGSIPYEYLNAIGTRVRLRLNPQILFRGATSQASEGIGVPFPGYRYLFAKFIPSTALGALKMKIQMIHDIDDVQYYPTGITVSG